MTTPTGIISIQIPNADGSITNLSASLAGASVTTTPAPPPANPEPTIPTTATIVDMLPASVPWQMNFDPGTQTPAGTAKAVGTTSYPATAPDGTPNCRKFDVTLTAFGGEIFHANVLKDSSAFNTFCYETEEYYPDASNLACIERDLEQGDPPATAGATTSLYVDMATQLDGRAGYLDYTSSNPKGWQHTNVKANPMAIKPGWYITRRYFKNLGGGQVTYIGSFDNGVYSPLNITTTSQPGQQWGANILNLQYQFDGLSAGTAESVIYARVLRVHCWKS